MAVENMFCQLGTQDIPVIQDQPKFVVDLLDSNVFLFGASMSGKTNFLRLLVTILNKQYRENQEQIFILDFGGSLADVEKLPLVAAYFDNSNEEYVKRVFKLMEDQLRENIRILKAKNYRAVSENQPIHTTLMIDNVNAFLDEPRYTAYQEKLAKLCRDGLSKGITVVLTASTTKGTNTIISCFKQKIALEMPVDVYSEIFGQKVIPVGNNPGHGFANVTVNTADATATYPMQMPYELQINVSDDVSSEEFSKNVEKYFEGRTVKKFHRFPDVLTKKGFEDFSECSFQATDCKVSLGLDYTECKPVEADFEATRCMAVYGKKGFGKTNLLRLLLKGFLSSPIPYSFVFFDDGRGQLQEFERLVDEDRKKYIVFQEEVTLFQKAKVGSNEAKAGILEEEKTKLSPMQLFIKFVQENFIDLTQVRRLSNLVLGEIFGSSVLIPHKPNTRGAKNTVFVLQSKFLYVNSLASKDFMEVILPLMVAQAEEMNWFFIFSDVKAISDAETRENFHSTIGTAYLLDSIAEFVGERGGKSIFGSMDVKSLKEEYAPCELGDGYSYSIEKDELVKLKFIKEKED